MGLGASAEKQAEWAVAEAKVQADRDASMKQIMLNHQFEGNMLTPPKGWCGIGVGHVTQLDKLSALMSKFSWWFRLLVATVLTVLSQAD